MRAEGGGMNSSCSITGSSTRGALLFAFLAFLGFGLMAPSDSMPGIIVGLAAWKVSEGTASDSSADAIDCLRRERRHTWQADGCSRV